MKLLAMPAVVTVVAAVTAVTGMSLAHAEVTAKVDPLAATLTRLGEAANCTDKASPQRPWCIAAGFGKGAAGTLPKKALVGMTVELEDGKDVVDALTNSVTFVALAIDKDGKVKLTDIKPSGPEDARSVGEAVAAAAMVFKDKAKTAKLPKELSDFVKTLKGAYATKKASNAWTWTGKSASRLRKVGKFYVIIEQPESGNGLWATILTDAWE